MMKRLLIFAALIVAIGSIGGNMLTAHAQTAPTVTATTMSSLTPAQIASLKQQLQVAQAMLINLEMQNGIATPADAGTPNTIPASIAGTGVQGAAPVVAATTGFSASQIGAIETTLSALSATLGQLNASLAANTLTPSQEASVVTALNGMQGALVAMASNIANGGSNPTVNTVPIAATAPASAPVVVNNVPSAAAMPSTPVATITAVPSTTVVTQTQPATAPANNVAPQTAQASSLWSFTKTHWPTIVIVLLVIAILAILFWPEKKEPVRTVLTATMSGSGKPRAPTPNVIMSQSQNAASASASSATATPPPATPVASAVAAPSQK